MTEPEWLSSADPAAMLAFLRGRTSDRKLRLFAVACCRDVWDLIVGMEQAGIGFGCTSVQLGELLADGQATPGAVRGAIQDRVGLIDSGYSPDGFLLTYALPGLADTDALRGATRAAWGASTARGRQVRNQAGIVRQEGGRPSEASRAEGQAATVATSARQATLLRDISSPFALPLDPRWRTSTVLSLARGIDTDRAFDRLPILADALEDAGCARADVLAHGRGPGPHVRGCWVVDEVLGKG